MNDFCDFAFQVRKQHTEIEDCIHLESLRVCIAHFLELVLKVIEDLRLYICFDIPCYDWCFIARCSCWKLRSCHPFHASRGRLLGSKLSMDDVKTPLKSNAPSSKSHELSSKIVEDVNSDAACNFENFWHPSHNGPSASRFISSAESTASITIHEHPSKSSSSIRLENQAASARGRSTCEIRSSGERRVSSGERRVSSGEWRVNLSEIGAYSWISIVREQQRRADFGADGEQKGERRGSGGCAEDVSMVSGGCADGEPRLTANFGADSLRMFEVGRHPLLPPRSRFVFTRGVPKRGTLREKKELSAARARSSICLLLKLRKSKPAGGMKPPSCTEAGGMKPPSCTEASETETCWKYETSKQWSLNE
ncbi:hypothetical protein LXL04_006918 [Taraxacum kok-saghyz]